ncbi:MAG: ion transporter [Candidatus Pacebacteria bacterium]|nr:ion transporter [Candidatus Paceibacterota bacterium]MCD8527934.1 ion transporter [Candidatus Paceibacterota bacterium]MCD8563728.1 ion transporter [Candidatus Paceibacterota bacterium]
MHTWRTRIHETQHSFWYEMIFVILALLATGLFITELSTSLDASVIRIFHSVDMVVVSIFITDFIIGIIAAPRALRYVRTHWMDILASIPVSGGIFQTLRILRLFRLGRILGYIQRKVLHTSHELTNRKRIIYLSVFAFSVVLFGATSFFLVEGSVNPTVTSFLDAVYWASVTATTVGYGDIFAMTVLGKWISIVLMFAGVILFGSIAGFMGSIFVQRK